MTDFFSYNTGSTVVPPNSFRISPSQLSRFFDSTNQWCREFLLGEAPAFEGSNASELGTCVHAAANMYAVTQTVDHTAIQSYVNSLPAQFDKQYILDQYPVMVDQLIANHLQYNLPDQTEVFLYHELVPGIGVGGSIDAIHTSEKTIRDYKTTSSRTQVTRFPRPYYFQQLAYAYLCKQHGIEITTLELIYITTSELNRVSEKTGKRLQDYPSIVYPVTHVITDEDWSLIESTLKLIAHTVRVWKEQPDLRWLIAQDFRLAPMSLLRPPPKIFNRSKQ